MSHRPSVRWWSLAEGFCWTFALISLSAWADPKEPTPSNSAEQFARLRAGMERVSVQIEA